jgi:dTDP-4-amino-4,6-dideoxygalactose transaminase
MPGHYYFDPRLRDTRMSGLTARALARVDVASSIQAHLVNYACLQDALKGVPGIAPLFPHLDPHTVPLGMPVLVVGGRRNGLARALQAEGIAATPWWAGYNRRLDFAHQPEACALKDSVLFLPVRPPLDPAAMDRIASRTAAILASLR